MTSPQDDAHGVSPPKNSEISPLQETVAVSQELLPEGKSSSNASRSSGASGARAAENNAQNPLSLIGQHLGERYRLERLLGKGGMGAVFECVDEQNAGQHYALKVVLGSAQDPDALRRFVREARASRDIQSEHVVRVIDAETDGERNLPYIVMELLSGEDLDQLVKRVGPLEPATTCRLFIQACEGLAAAHANGIIHRDIKPANLFLHRLSSGKIVAKICDFGVAKQTGLDTSQTSELTQTGGMVGSPMYMSPEQARSAKHVDHRTDIWSLALSLHQALSGQKPWAQQSGSLGELILAICTAEMTPLQDLAPWIPPGLADTIHHAILREPSERYATIDEFRAALEPFAAPAEKLTIEALTSISDSVRGTVAPRAAGFGASRSSGASPLSKTVPESVPSPTSAIRRSPYLVPGAVFAGVTGVGLAALFAFRPAPSPAPAPVTTVVQREIVTVVSVAAPAPPPSASAKVSGTLRIKGVPTKISVNGALRELPPSGELLIEGDPGESFFVEVEVGKIRRPPEKVTLSRDGTLSPPEIVIVGGGVAPRPSSAPVVPSKTTSPPATTQAPKPPPANTVKPRDEF